MKSDKEFGLIKEYDLEEVWEAAHSSQQFGTVIFEREDDHKGSYITVVSNYNVRKFTGDNKYNPSPRRRSSCVYSVAEWDASDIIKVCTIQHKGTTSVEIHKVGPEELAYFFNIVLFKSGLLRGGGQ